MDFVATWKAASIAITGAFGILGLVKDFKDKATNRITVWGYMSLAGILTSTAFGIAVQLKESADDAARALVLARNSEQTLMRSEQTLLRSEQTLQRSEQTLTGIQRILTPLDQARFTVTFDVPCASNEFAATCADGRSETLRSKSDSFLFPGDDAIQGELASGITLELAVYRNVDDLEDALRNLCCDESHPGDLATMIEGRYDGGDDHWAYIEYDLHPVEHAELTISNVLGDTRYSNGKLISMLDLHGCALTLRGDHKDLVQMTPKLLMVKAKNGEQLEVTRFMKTAFSHIHFQDVYRAVFP